MERHPVRPGEEFLMLRSATSCLLLFLVITGCRRPAPPPAPRTLTLAVIPRDTTSEFWKSVHAGAARAAQEAGIEIIWKGPVRESDTEVQINLVHDFVTRGVDGICLAPQDSQALIPAVQQAHAAGIPTVILDSGLGASDGIVSFVATNNYHGGRMAARHLGALLGSKGRILMLRYRPGDQATEQREAGFLETIQEEFPEIQVLSDSEYAGDARESARDKSQQLLIKFGDQVDGVFTSCQHVSSGMLKALEECRLAGKVRFVGFDAAPELVQALKAKQMHGIVLQDPVRMGELAVRTLIAHLRGEPVERQLLVEESLATPDNLANPQIRRLLEPEQK